MKKYALMIIALLFSTPVHALNGEDPNLNQASNNSTEGRALECHKCESTNASSVDRHEKLGATSRDNEAKRKVQLEEATRFSKSEIAQK